MDDENIVLENEKPIIKFAKEIIPYIIIIIVVLLFRTYIATPVRVNGGSMDKTLSNGEILILNKISNVKRGDIVVVDIGTEKVIKRIVAIGGETIYSKNGKLYINDKVVDEPFVSSKLGKFDKVVVPDGKYFVMGDNRLISLDSRSFGPVSKEQILGKANIVLFPFNKIGVVK